MKAMVQMAKVIHQSKTPLLEKEFLRLYSRWHETHDELLKRRMFQSIGRLLNSDPGFDFRKRLWQAL